MLSTTSFKHPITKKRIMQAGINVLKNGYSVDHIRKANGQAYAAVRLGTNGLFIVTDKDGRDITQLVSKAL